VTTTSRIVARLCKLPPARTSAVSVEQDLDVKMSDGAVLLADRWHPTMEAGAHPPVVLLRSPYGRHQLGIVGRLFAERGYQVVIQSCRGSFGSAGRWDPFHHEPADGRDTLAWIESQPWFGGSIATFGPSYLGITQWSLLDDPQPAHLRAIAPTVTATAVRDAVIYPGGSFALETAMTWIHQLEHQEEPTRRRLLAMRARRPLDRGAAAFPLNQADRANVGHVVPYFQDWMEHAEPGDPWWDTLDFGHHLDGCPPAAFLGGWYDIFLPAQVADFEALQQRGIPARLTIGPWTHAALAGMGTSIREGLAWFDAHLGGGRPDPGGVRLFVMGDRRWVDLPSWPPPASVRPWYLHTGGRLAPTAPLDGRPERYRYDPADPTPSAGGPSLDAKRAGRKDQRARESRSDVLTYTSEALTSAVTVAGPMTVRLHLRSTLEHTDIYVRLCDVSGKGRSENLSDGILRIRPGMFEPAADGTLPVAVQMWPTANTFRAGHRIRLQVSAGAHPLFARNPGTGEPLGSASTFRTAEHEIFHDADHPSAIELPITSI
jgi:putative CocE/NonD family hydrolase